VTVEVLYFDGCPNHEVLMPRLREIVTRTCTSTSITTRRIINDEAAKRERFLGSPTVRIDGRDIEPGADQRSDFGLKCRLYRTASGLAGQPEDEWLHAALRGAGEAHT
jgi:hypothetical protein